MCVRVCGERASFQALLALPLSLLVSRRLPACVCLDVLESVLFFGAQKAQHTLKDTWPALPAATLTSTANENKIVCMCVEDSLSGLKQRWAALRCAANCALPLPLPMQAAVGEQLFSVVSASPCTAGQAQSAQTAVAAGSDDVAAQRTCICTFVRVCVYLKIRKVYVKLVKVKANCLILTNKAIRQRRWR